MTRDMKKGIGVALAVAAGLGAFAGVDFTQYVDPAIGTEYNGHTHVAASYPFGMVQAGPTSVCSRAARTGRIRSARKPRSRLQATTP